MISEWKQAWRYGWITMFSFGIFYIGWRIFEARGTLYNMELTAVLIILFILSYGLLRYGLAFVEKRENQVSVYSSLAMILTMIVFLAHTLSIEGWRKIISLIFLLGLFIFLTLYSYEREE